MLGNSPATRSPGTPALILVTFALGSLGGCYAGFNTIDSRVNRLLEDASGDLGSGAPVPTVDSWGHITVSEEMLDEKHPPTWNPAADEMIYVPTAKTDAEEVLVRLQQYQIEESGAFTMGLQEALVFGRRQSPS